MSGPCALAVALLSLAVPTSAQERVDLGGATLVPPPGFRRVDDAMIRGSTALVPLVAGEAPRGLLAVFAEGGEEGALTLSVGRVEGPLDLDARTRSNLPSAIAEHFRGELDLEVVVDRPVWVDGPSGPRFEVRAQTQAGGGPRRVRFAFVPAGVAYYVLSVSLPAEREVEHEALVDGVFDSLTPSAQPLPKPDVVVRAGVFGVVGVLVVVALHLWRRRRGR